MSRLLIAACLSTTLFTSFAIADRVARFAQPPTADVVSIAPRTVVDRDAVRTKLAANRKANIDRFLAYQRKGVFPSNTYTDDKLNVWRDADGNLCAAATIINASGKSDLVLKIADTDNFIRLADVKQGALMDWILTSGLTQDEIAAIQEPFDGVGEDQFDGRIQVTVRSQPRVDPAKRKSEDARLMAKYRSVYGSLLKSSTSSLDKATDRLMKNPTLAAAFVNG